MVQTMTATGLSLSKTRKKKRKKNIRKSGGGSKAYRLRRILERLSAIKDACGVARLIWGLPTLRYVDECCCKDNQHLNNIKEEEIGEIYNAARANSRYCLLAAFPGGTILDPIMAFKGEDNDTELTDLISSGGVSISKEGGPVHLTETAYRDIAKCTVDTITGKTAVEAVKPARKRLESVVTRSASDPLQATGCRPASQQQPGRRQGSRQCTQPI